METLSLFGKVLLKFLRWKGRWSIENNFDRKYFPTFAWNTGNLGRFLGTPENTQDLSDSSNVRRWYFEHS